MLCHALTCGIYLAHSHNQYSVLVQRPAPNKDLVFFVWLNKILQCIAIFIVSCKFHGDLRRRSVSLSLSTLGMSGFIIAWVSFVCASYIFDMVCCKRLVCLCIPFPHVVHCLALKFDTYSKEMEMQIMCVCVCCVRKYLIQFNRK